MSEPATAPSAVPASRGAKAQLAAYQAARVAAIEQFSATSRIQHLWRALTEATDRLLAAHGCEGVSIIATGGYGRCELFPYSDVDILLLVDEDTAPKAADGIVHMLQQLWDMQVPVSHAVRSPAEAVETAREDHTIAAALMDARLVQGDRKQFMALKRALKQRVFGADKRGFVAAKLADRDARHLKWGDSRFVLEPNIKDGKGGLRDLHTLNWLARYCYGLPKAGALVREDLLTPAEWKHYRNAYLFFAAVRAHMHLLRGRADERLTFDLQTQIAAKLKFRGRTAQEKASRFMLRYFQFTRGVGALTRIFCTVLEEENHRTILSASAAEARASRVPEAFVVEHGRLNFAPGFSLGDDPCASVALFAIAQQEGLDIHPRGYLAIVRALPGIGRKLPFERVANQHLLEIVLGHAPDTHLRRMNDCGLLAAILPEFGRVVGMMQYDGYHTYTVDEHTLMAVGNVAMIEAGEWTERLPLASKVAGEIADRAALYLGMLCHDLAKGTGGQHAEKGEAIAARIGARLGLSTASGELAGWLVANHLRMSDTAFRRDLDDPQTILDFVHEVQSPERLRLLLLVTLADIKAVGPTIWNGWKGSLMRQLYRRAMVQMGVERGGESIEELQQHWLAHVAGDLQQNAQHFLEQRLPQGFWHRRESEQDAAFSVYRRWGSNKQEVALQVAHDAFRDFTDITCCLTQQPGLFRVLAGVMALSGASIVSARIMVLADGAAIATLHVQDVHGHSFADNEKRLAALPKLIAQALAGSLDLGAELPRLRHMKRARAVSVEPNVFIDNKVSAQASVIEINARDRIGLLHDVLAAMEACQLQVITAHIATYGTKAVDVFYVKDSYGFKIIHQNKIASVQQALIAAIEGTTHA